MSTDRDNPQGLPESELVRVVRRNPESGYDWVSVLVDPALVKPVRQTVIPRHGMTTNEVHAYNAALRAKAGQ